MKKDIDFPVVKDVYLTVALTGENEWTVYLINRQSQVLTHVMVTSKGYGSTGTDQQKTSTLRHVIPLIGSGNYAQIERIDPSVFHLTNEYWVSFFIDKQLYDKKYLFLPDSITSENLIFIEELQTKGVLHP
jgi:hypothetical protein